MLRNGYMDAFIFNILEKNRSYYNSLSLEDFMEREMINDEIVREFRAFMRQENFEFKFVNYQPVLRRYLKAAMAQQLYGSTAFEQIVNEEDLALEKIIELSKEKNLKK